MKLLKLLQIILIFEFLINISPSISFSSEDLNVYKGLFLTPEHSTKKWLDEILHYYKQAGLNAVVIHAKTPRGRVYWNSKNKTAISTGAVYPSFNILKPMKFFNDNGVRTIAKIDVFMDSNLADKKKEFALKNSKTGEVWKNKNGLSWVNPYDERVWAYNIELAKELSKSGFNEIQFDYIRFPSDGDLKSIKYNKFNKDIKKEDVISNFLKQANKDLKNFNVDISCDIFGLTAWKKTDFGVGQVLEKISPNVDIICPMFYPSHFPKGFLGIDKPKKRPKLIVQKSMEKILKRTNKEIRPWIQAFNYSPEEIVLQIKGIENTGVQSFFAWNASTRYYSFYTAMEKMTGKKFITIKFYKDINDLKKLDKKSIRGKKRIVNYTDYKKGITIFSLEKSTNKYLSHYFAPVNVIKTFDEAILDEILKTRDVKVSQHWSLYFKAAKVTDFFLMETGNSADKIMENYYFINWGKGQNFIKMKNKDLIKDYDINN